MKGKQQPFQSCHGKKKCTAQKSSDDEDSVSPSQASTPPPHASIRYQATVEDVPDEDDFFSSNASVRNETRPAQATTTHNNSDDVESTEDGLSASCLILMVLLAHNVSEHMMKDWNAPIYTFFKPLPKVVVKDGRCAHEFMCFA